MYLRFYYHCNKIVEDATISLFEHIQIIDKYNKINRSFDTINKDLLEAGACYVYGRDNCLRPIIIFNFRILLEHSLNVIHETLYFS